VPLATSAVSARLFSGRWVGRRTNRQKRHYGRTATFNNDMPKGWVSLLAFWSEQPVFDLRHVRDDDWVRDAVLCPQHVKALEEQLKDMGRAGSTLAIGEG
jgi:hypothetical protein